ncbi:MAG: hypothetical protein PVG22_12545 [Chromatiales bacterium]|jgi:hypothetical protein
MKKFLTTTLLSLAFGCSLVFAHHAAEGIVDDEIYEQIDALLEDTPHADMTLEDLASGSTTMVIEIDDQATYDQLMDDGLDTLINDLVGDTTVIITDTSDGGYLITVVNSGSTLTVEDNADNYNGDGSGTWD